jgi:hypothetical protein
VKKDMKIHIIDPLEMTESAKNPPRFAIENGCVIGHLPQAMYLNVDEVISMIIALARPHMYAIGISGRQHKTMQGKCTFFNQI